MMVSREVWGLRDGTPTNKKKKHQQTRKTPTNKKKHQQTRETPFEQGKHLSSKGNAFQARGIFRSNVKVCKW